MGLDAVASDDSENNREPNAEASQTPGEAIFPAFLYDSISSSFISFIKSNKRPSIKSYP